MTAPRAICLALLFLTLMIGSAKADVVFYSDNGDCFFTCEIVNMQKDTSTGPSGTGFITGLTNQDQLEVQFTSTSGELFSTANGAAKLSSPTFNQLGITMPDYYFNELQLRFVLPKGRDAQPATQLSVTVNWVNISDPNNPIPGSTSFSSPTDFPFPDGDDRYAARIVVGSGQAIDSLALTGSGGLFGEVIDVKTAGYIPREGGGTPPDVPEPSTMALLGGGLSLIGLARLRRKIF